MRAQLTKKLVTSAQPKERPYELRDISIPGLIFRVQPSGYKAWIIEWARGKRRTLGAFGHLTLEQARAHAAQAMAETIQQGLPSIARTKPDSCTLNEFLTTHYTPWAKVELKGGARYVDRIRVVFSELLHRPINQIDPVLIDEWWRGRLTTDTRTGNPPTKATAARDLACLRSALSQAVEWKLLTTNTLMGLRKKSVESRKVVRSLSPDEESRLRRALSDRNRYLIEARVSGNRWRALRGEALYPELPADGFGDHLAPVVLLAMNTGLRRGELLSLCWSDVNLQTAMLTIRAETAKSGRSVTCPSMVKLQLCLLDGSCSRMGWGVCSGLETSRLDGAGC